MILLTACTARKISADDRISPKNVAKGSLTQVSERWASLLTNSVPEVPAGQLYAGPGPAIARNLHALGVRWHIVSAGVGLVSSRGRVPHYDCTISGDTQANVLSRITGSRPRASEWWTALTESLGRARPLRRLIVGSEPDTVCLALPAAYFDMVVREIDELPADAISRLRLFVADAGKLPPDLRLSAMPYDARIDGSQSPYAGTRATFAVRTAFHFITEVFMQAPSGSVVDHARLVREACNSWPNRRINQGDKRSDREIRAAVRRLLREGVSSCTAQLRILRTTEGIACEQQRFLRLFREVASG